MINCVCKDHRDKIKVPDPVVKDLISKKICKANNSKKRARLISRSAKDKFNKEPAFILHRERSRTNLILLTFFTLHIY